MTAKKNQAEETETDTIPTITEESNNLGDIKINHSVVASIVRLAALEVDGTYAVGGSGFVDNLSEIFAAKNSDRGVRVAEDEGGNYIIEVRVVMRFGVKLAETAVRIQQNVRDQIESMTMKTVARVDVIIDGVRLEEKEGTAEDWEEAPHTD